MKRRGTKISKSIVNLDDLNRTATLARQRERSNWVASRLGLPTIGSKMLNKYGIEWRVIGHEPVPTYDSLHRWRQGDIQPQADMYPLLAPQNLSAKLTEFMCAINRCTTKSFAIVDTMPGRRNDGHVPGGNSLDTLCHPEANIVFLDAARVHETIIAHEFGHAWVQYVDECEDLRTLDDASDPQRMRQVGFVQSFVLDLKVNELIARKGFDMSPIRNDQGMSLFQLAELLSGGYQPGYPAEEVFMALTVADAMIQRERGQGIELARFDNSLATIEGTLAPMVGLADRFAGSVRRHGYDSHASITACIDECLLASFEHCGDRIDLDAELLVVNPGEPNTDKFPEWLPLLVPRAKCSVGKFMARNDISSDWSQMIAPSITGMAKLTFVSPKNDQRSELPLGVTLGPPTRYSHLGELEAELLAMKIRNRTGSLQLHGGPPHQRDSCFNSPPQPLPGHGVHDHALGPRFPGLTRPQPPLGHGDQGQTPDPRFRGPTLPPGFQGEPNWPGRPYMAGTARFLTAVRLEQQLAGEPPYAYALNNPVTYIDPLGDQPIGRPVYNPTFWNDPSIQPFNNCYNYACQLPKGNFMQPGGPHPPYNNFPGGTPSCTNILANAIHDGAIPVSKKYPSGCPGGWHKICVFVTSTGSGFTDYHWYRQDKNGTWSDKPGGTAAVNCLDGTSIPIRSPGSDARLRGYPIKCGCLCAKNRSGVY